MSREFKTPCSSYSQMLSNMNLCISSRSSSTLADNTHSDQQYYSLSNTSPYQDDAAECRDPHSIPTPWFETHKATDTCSPNTLPHCSASIPGGERSSSSFNAPNPLVLTQLQFDLPELPSPSSSPAVTHITLDVLGSPLPACHSPRNASASAVDNKHALFYMTDSMVTLEVSYIFCRGCSALSDLKTDTGRRLSLPCPPFLFAARVCVPWRTSVL
jgi:hypothetical protein